ncbi:YdcF family protein [Bacillus spongiae]|uniref:YdcF family protein n=1 Tax=Bacillus spongiae TaxID=2683610 RepID=A0ABU8HBE2_9BACI
MIKRIFYITGGLFFLYGLLLLTKNNFNLGILLFIVGGLVLFSLAMTFPFWKHMWLQKRWFRHGTKLLIILSVTMLFIMESLILYHTNDQSNQKVDYVLVLGAGIKNGQPSLLLENRLNTAVEYLQNNISTDVIVTGGIGQGETTSEAAVMKDYLLKQGIDEARIIIEDQATSTYENIAYSIPLMEESTDTKVLIITSDFHLFRAKMIADSLDLTPYGVGASVPFPIIPVVHTREIAAIVKTLIWDI